MRYISFAFLSQRTRASLFRRFAHSKHFLQPPILGLSHTRNSMQSPMPRPPTPDGVRHVDKKPRLDLAEELANGFSDAPVQRTVLDRGKDKTENGWKKLSKRTARKAKKQKHALPEPYSNEHVIQLEIKELLGESTVEAAEEEGREWSPPFESKTELELTVSALSSTGESLSITPAPYPPWVIITPFALPGETIRVRVYRSGHLSSHADLLEIVKPNPELRDDTRVQCKYFTKCAGCQYQMLSYETQLDLKRNVIVRAYKNFSDLPLFSVPTIQPTIGSPLQYGYRTKITPHFDVPAKKFKPMLRDYADGSKPDWFNVGFNKIGTRTVLDIEECPIATPVLNKSMGPARENIFKNLDKYKKGVSLLFRESLRISAEDVSKESLPSLEELASVLEDKVCVTDHRGTILELVGDKFFEYTAGSFFQNNNSVLVPLTSYVRDAIFPESAPPDPKPTHLVDAYCGSGLFSIMLSPHFDVVRGIELSAEGIRASKVNARLNRIPNEKISFLEGDAANIFDTVQEFPRERTVLIIDPPRKGSDENFINQLIQFACQTVVYVSCNVHTQARDVGMILRKSEKEMVGKKYALESVRGFDLFPQTAHVESVAVLKLVDADQS